MQGIIAEQLGVEEDKVVPGASFTDDLGPRGGQRRRKREKDSQKYSWAVGHGFTGGYAVRSPDIHSLKV